LTNPVPEYNTPTPLGENKMQEKEQFVTGYPSMILHKENGKRSVVLMVLTDEDIELAGYDQDSISDKDFMLLSEEVRDEIDGSDALSSTLFWACDKLRFKNLLDKSSSRIQYTNHI
jgi:hypothetical protein